MAIDRTKKTASNEFYSIQKKLINLDGYLGNKERFTWYLKDLNTNLQDLLDATASNNDTCFNYDVVRITCTKSSTMIVDFIQGSLIQDLNLAMFNHQLKQELKLAAEFKQEYIVV